MLQNAVEPIISRCLVVQYYIFTDDPHSFSYFWSQVAKKCIESTNKRQGPKPSLCPGLGAALRFWAGPPKLKVWGGGAIKSAQLARAGARRRQLPRAWRARRARRVAKFGPLEVESPPCCSASRSTSPNMSICSFRCDASQHTGHGTRGTPC